MGNTKIAGYPYGEVAVSSPDGPNQFAALGLAVEKDVILTFASEADRNARITAPKDFMLARIAPPGVQPKLTYYKTGAWHDYGFRQVPVEPWKNIVFQPGWGQWNDDNWGPASYTKDGLGWVHMRGIIQRLTGGDPALFAVLPPGYRPPDGSHYYAVHSSPGATRVDVNGDGTLRISVSTIPANNWVILSNVVFYAGV